MFAILHGWRLEGMAASIHKTFGDRPCRSELAMNPRTPRGIRFPALSLTTIASELAPTVLKPHGIPQRVVSNPSHKSCPQRVGDDVSGSCFQVFLAAQGSVEVTLLP